MKRLASTLLLLGAFACGSGEPFDARPVGAGPPSEGRNGTWRGGSSLDVEAKDDAALHPSVPRCLDLARAGELVAALGPCTEALEAVPDDHDVAAALERAQAATRAQASAAVGVPGDETPFSSEAAPGATGIPRDE